MDKMNICLLFGGVSPEHEVSLSTATSILQNIDHNRFNVHSVGITKDGSWFLFSGNIEELTSGEWVNSPNNIPALLSPVRGQGLLLYKDGKYSSQKIDCVFPALHGSNGEDGSIQGLCQISGIPCVGALTTASAISMDKSVTKAVVDQLGIRQAKYELVLKHSFAQNPDEVLDLAEESFTYPVFVKPASTGSSVGISKVSGRSQLKDAVSLALTYSDRVLIEEFFNGREIEVSVLGNEAPFVSVCGEILPGDEFYTYDDKYLNGVASQQIPANLPAETSDKIRKYAEDIFCTIGCAGLSRVDFFVHKVTGEICFNEINTLPGFTPISMYPKLCEYGGILYTDLLTRLIEFAL